MRDIGTSTIGITVGTGSNSAATATRDTMEALALLALLQLLLFLQIALLSHRLLLEKRAYIRLHFRDQERWYRSTTFSTKIRITHTFRGVTGARLRTTFTLLTNTPREAMPTGQGITTAVFLTKGIGFKTHTVVVASTGSLVHTGLVVGLEIVLDAEGCAEVG